MTALKVDSYFRRQQQICHNLRQLNATPQFRTFISRSLFMRIRLLASSYVCLSVLPSVRMEQLGSHWTDFHEIWYLNICRKYLEIIQVSLQ